jgi:hypothetical protein
MFALHRQTPSLAARFFFGIVAVSAVAFTSILISHPAKAQLRAGIGVGGIGGVLLDESRRQKSQQSEQYQRSQSGTESDSRKKTTKAKNQKPKRDESRIAKEKESSPKTPHEPVASAPQATPLTARPPPTPSNFGE